ncbi:EAL domain-containing protein [Vulcaniibacterium tengchongense]|uniref:Response regulator receiver modulated diguanylate cyclase/phosphodiesterase n=1 Tax=Vulcaniibacterium tengchongense TaxID=1273429 RepID=A0A3N4VNT3_9GAMM|nr:EAL domain-containing protein [Vulcaniibacterium tengchongense]RPE80891.1 response regulator receiver modulated diguanylate cyclase/phosphodiesterase [Vulcaniibacterium tengchongense]
MSQRHDDFGDIAVDPITGLHRLGANGPSLATAIAVAGATRRRIALLHIDVDMFRSINTNMGATVGDQALAAIAQRLRRAVPRDGWLWRLSSDEFVAGIGYRPGEPDGAALAERLRDAFETPLSIPPYTLPVTLSIGIAVFPDHAPHAAGLLAKAEEALRRVKQDGLNSVGLYSAQSEGEVAIDGLAQRFLEAIERDEFQLYYQPQVAAHDGSLTGFAALLRWRTEHGLLRPSQFLELANRVGLAARLGAWVLDAAAAQLAQWRAQGLDYLSMSVHLAGPLLVQRDCLDHIGELLHRYDLPGSALEFEISESVLATDAHRVHETLAGLRALGATLTVQDFGLGGLSFAALAQYRLDRIKIDRSFIRNVASDPRSAAIVRGIIAMGHQLGMKVVAKGVESEAELGFLRRNHCDFFQGYLFSPSLPADQLGDLVRKRFLLPSAFAATRPERTLLLVDDEENVLRSLVRLFRRDGYHILTASSVREAFDLLASNSAQVILSDQRMADMSGTEFLTRVRDLYPDTIRMVLSGYTDLATITDAINRGAIYRFLTKPWNDEELREHILDAFRAHERRAAGESGY